VEYVLKNLSRDWSADGASERAQAFGWIVEAAKKHVTSIPSSAGDISPPTVLVPGCGLARLPVDLAAAGFHAVGNEFSFFMLLTSSFVLNNLQEAQHVAIHPWVLTTCNQRSDAAQLRAVMIPDTPAAAVLAGGEQGRIGMVTGDFVDVFDTDEYKAAFDAVATCFFIDTAHNVIEYIKVCLNCPVAILILEPLHVLPVRCLREQHSAPGLEFPPDLDHPPFQAPHNPAAR
jgi:carnosine N-methyltransferase